MSSRSTNNPYQSRADIGAQNQMNRRRLLQMMGVGGLALGGASLLSACGGDSDSTPSDSGSTPGTTTPGTTTPGTGTNGGGAAGALKRGGSLTVALAGTGATGQLDPHLPIGDDVNGWAQTAFFENLARDDANFEPQNLLVEEISPDATGKTWTIRLIDGIEFHNGKTLDADDVAFSLMRAVAPPAFAGIQVGEIESTKTIDPLTLEVTLVEPRGWFDIGVRSGGITGIIPVDFDPRNPVSTGPFKYVRTVEGISATFERFENYHGDIALLDELILLPIEDPAARLNALLSNEVQVYTSIDPGQIAQLQGNDAFRIYNSPGSVLEPIQMRTDEGPLADVRVRQALRLVVDREQIVQSVFAGFAVPGNDLYGETDAAYTLGLKRERDVEAAKALMDEVGGSIDVVLTVNGTTSQGAALVLAENAKEIGINIDVQSVDSGTFYGPDYLEWQFLTGDIYPPTDFLPTGALVDAPGAAIGSTHFHDDEFAALWNEASASTDADVRSDRINQMQQILFDRGGWIVPAVGNTLGGHSADIGGFVSPDATGFGLRRWWEKVGYIA
jgi:peptide/nickel transport system substrate-binding protein